MNNWDGNGSVPHDGGLTRNHSCVEQDVARYLRNYGAISKKEQHLLSRKRVAVIGLGGLGGNVVENLARLGVGHLTLVDGDVFEESNLNRQLLSTTALIGQPKADAACRRIAEINPLVTVCPMQQSLTAENAVQILSGHDAVVDALDNISDRLILEQAASCLQIPLIHGAIAGWCGHVCTVLPGDSTLSYLYEGALVDPSDATADEVTNSSLSFAASFTAALQASETTKVLLGRGELTRGKLLQLDLLNNHFEQVILFLHRGLVPSP